MKIIQYNDKLSISSVINRVQENRESKFSIVQDILNDVQLNGDVALKKYTETFDGVELSEFRVTQQELINSEKELSSKIKIAIDNAIVNISQFHSAQLLDDLKVETARGVYCEQRSVPIESVGIYIPGGTAPLFSTVIMLGIPAKIAGCKEVVLVTPPNNDGSVSASIRYAAYKSGITKVFKVGGAQAIAALAFGTQSIPKVDKIFGPGNQFVTIAKQLVAAQGIAIDMPAGPSEVAVIADKYANPVFVAADLLAQAEHGVDSQVVLITDSPSVVEQTLVNINRFKLKMPRKGIIDRALDNSFIVMVNSIDEAVKVSNQYAPEHLIISTRNARDYANKIVNAGSVFIGELSPESAGDYAAGTNHTLPTNGAAKAFSGVNTQSFMKKITFQELSPIGIQTIGQDVMLMADAEGLFAHKLAMEVRLNKILSNNNQ